MKNWIRTNIIAIIVVLALLFVILLQKCGVKHTENVINQTEIQQAVNQVKDSLQSLHYIELIANYKSGQDAEAKKTIEVKRKLAQIKISASELKFKNDSLKKLIPVTDTLCNTVVGSMQAEIDTIKAENVLLDIEAESYSRQLYLCEKQSYLKDTVILNKIDLINRSNDLNRKLSKELKAKNNWFNRNKIWIGVVVGSVGTFLIVK